MSANANRQAGKPIDVTRVSAAVGAQVECGDVKALDAATFAAVHAAFLDNVVLLIRGQQLTVADLLAFGRRFGELTPGAPVHIGQKPRDEQYPELAIISNVIENGVAIGGLGDGIVEVAMVDLLGRVRNSVAARVRAAVIRAAAAHARAH